MTPSRARFVTVCQQLLALAVVLAVLTPAARVVSLDVVGTGPHGGTEVARPTAALAAYTAEAVQPSKVPTAPVKSVVREVQLTAPTAAVSGRAVPMTTQARITPGRSTGTTRLVTRPQVVTGFGEVGVTWAHGAAGIPETGIAFAARTRTHGVWSSWAKIPYDPDHAPDPNSAEGRHARPGTDPMLVGKVGHVQVRAITSRPLPVDMKLAVIAPGKASRSTTERAAIDTSTMDGNTGQDSVYRAAASAQPVTGSGDTASLAAAVFTPEPVIYSRAQWGADESIRGKSSLHYGDVHAGFVHHTVNANDYTRNEVPALMRSIYAYHVKSRGWSDIGYNYLIDRFGRIWEGRYGGVDRAVVGAHTLNYNDDSFAASAIGNYQIAQPSQAMIQAYATLFAWKLSLHGIDAASTHQYVTSRWFEAINGHRDAASTLCPGQYLYDKIPEIRSLAAAAQRGWTGRQLESNLAGSPNPDLVVRRASDGEAFVIPTGGSSQFQPPTRAAGGLANVTGALVTPSVTGDGAADVLVRKQSGLLTVRPGNGAGRFGHAVKKLKAFRGLDLPAAPGDLNGDGHNDLIARNAATGRLIVFLGKGHAKFTRTHLGANWKRYNLISAAGDVNGDGNRDLVARARSGKLWLRLGEGNGHFGQPVQVPGDFSPYDVVTGYGDFNGDGHDDLFLRTAADGSGWIMPGQADGTYGAGIGPFSGFAGVGSLTGGNVIGGSSADLVGTSGSHLVVIANQGSSLLGAPIDTGANFASANKIMKAGDWDRDGYGDVITRDTATGSLYLWRGNGTGQLGQPTLLGAGFAKVRQLAAVGDMTGDGFPDLMGAPSGGPMRIYPGRGLAGFGASYPATASSIKTAGQQIGVGLWNGDGAPDSLFRKGKTLTLYQGNGPGGLASPSQLPIDLSPYDWVIGVSAIQLTGHPDLIVRTKNTGQLYELPGGASGFGAPVYLGDGMGGYDLAG